MTEPPPALLSPDPSPETPAAPLAAADHRQAFWRSSRVRGAAALLLLAALLAAGIAEHQATQALREETARRLAEAEAKNRETGTLAAQAQEAVRDAQAKIALVEARLAESQTQQAALEALYRELTPSRDDFLLNEVEQMLLVASQQLQLAGNAQIALAGLQAADARLQRSERPQFIPLRRAIARDMERLKALPYVDVTGMNLRLDQIVSSVDRMPFAFEERPASAPPPAENKDQPAWRRALAQTLYDFRQLVRIESLDKTEPPLLAPSQQYFLRENLRLRLLAARLALLSRDEASFRADLKAADDWLKRYFDAKAKPVQIASATLKQFQTSELVIELPDLSGSLNALRNQRLARERGGR
jgi:uroporphyrin-3 C-methyltransferase